MKITDLRRIYNVIEYTLASEREKDINFIRNDMRKVLINYAIKSAECNTAEERKHVISVVDKLILNYVETIKLKKERAYDLNDYISDNFVHNKASTKDCTKIPSVEKKIESIQREYDKKPFKFQQAVNDIVLNLSKEEAFSIGGVTFEDYDPENSPYEKTFRFNGDGLISAVESGLKPDNVVVRDGLLILCFEELGYSFDLQLYPDYAKELLDSFESDKRIKQAFKEEMDVFSHYDDARSVAGFMIDEVCEFFGEKYREQLNKKAESLTMLSLTSLEMGVVFGREAHIHRYKEAFDGLPDVVQDTMKDAYMEIIKDKNHSDAYVNGAREFIQRNSVKFSQEESMDIFESNVEKGLELYRSGSKDDLARHIERMDPFSRAALRLEIKYGSQDKESDNSPSI